MRLIQKLLQIWNRLWFDEIPAYPIAAFRILFGLYVALRFVAMSDYVSLHFSNQGVNVPFMVPDIAPSVPVAWLLYCLLVIFAVSLAAGFKSQLSAICMFLLLIYHYAVDLASTMCSFDRLTLLYAFLLCFQNTGRVWSLDNIAKSAPQSTTVRAWLTRLIALHLFSFYFAAGIHKFMSPAWHTSDILRYTWSSTWASDLALYFVSKHWDPLLYSLMAHATMFWECLAICLFIKSVSVTIPGGARNMTIAIPVQKLYMLAGLGFHIMIWSFMNLPQFMVCVLVYPLYLNGDEVKQMGESLLAFLQKRIPPVRS